MSEVPDWPEFRIAHPGARPTEWLRAAAEPDWSAAVGHRFALACNHCSPVASTRWW